MTVAKVKLIRVMPKQFGDDLKMNFNLHFERIRYNTSSNVTCMFMFETD